MNYFNGKLHTKLLTSLVIAATIIPVTIHAQEVQSLEHDILLGADNSLVQVDADTYALAYRGDSHDGFLKNFTISARGTFQASQMITFADPSDQTFAPSGTFSAPASSDSGLTVLITSNSTSVCTVSGNTVTMVSVGSCSLTASQAGDSSFLAATPVSQTVVIVSENSHPAPTLSYWGQLVLILSLMGSLLSFFGIRQIRRSSLGQSKFQ